MAETPRELDRYETATDALERIARAFDANPTAQHSSAAVASILRYLAHEAPAAAPAAAQPSEPVAPAEVCRAEVSSRFPDYSHFECTLRKGHAGPHKEGSFAEWTDATTFEEPPKP